MIQAFKDVSIDSVRDYWNARPCNIRHSTREVGERAYFDEVEARKYFVEPHIPGFADFERWRGKRVLEIGCGIGTDTMNFARAGARVTAIDLSDRSLEIAKKRAEVFGLDNIEFHHGNAEALATALGDLMADEGRLQMLREGALAHVRERFSIEREARALVDLYNSLLSD